MIKKLFRKNINLERSIISIDQSEQSIMIILTNQDRVMTVRVAAADCLLQMLDTAAFLVTAELESLAALCFRAFEGANYDAR